MEGSSREYYMNGFTNLNSVGKVESVDDKFVICGEYLEGVSSVLQVPSLDSFNTRSQLPDQVKGENSLKLEDLLVVFKDAMQELPLKIKAEPEEHIYDDSFEKDESPSENECEIKQNSSSDLEVSNYQDTKCYSTKGPVSQTKIRMSVVTENTQQSKVNEKPINLGKKRPVINGFSWSCCNHQFKYFRAFNQHKVQQHNIAEYKCAVCNNRLFSSLIEIERHYLAYHCSVESTSFECSNCKLVFTVLSSFLEHRDKCCEARVICTQILDSIVDFVDTKGEKKGDVSCDNDDDVSINEVKCSAVQDGILCQCPICSRIMEKTQSINGIAKPKNNSHNKPFSCEPCNLHFRYESRLKRHLKTHEGLKEFPCDVCGSAFTKKTSLEKHKLYSHTSNPFKVTCSICNKVLVNKSSLKKHIRTVHLHVKMPTLFRCEYCGKTHSCEKNHQRHVHQVHLKDREFICAHCNRTYYDKQALSVHIQRSHLPSVTYKCEICGYVLNSKPALSTHLNVKHSEKEFNCEICGKIFKTKLKLQTHAAGHSDEKPFVCQTCGKGFKRYCNLQQHLYTHSDSRPHICSICGQSFRLRTHVKQHMAVHGLIRNHKCFVCNQMFARKGELNLHLLEHGV